MRLAMEISPSFVGSNSLVMDRPFYWQQEARIGRDGLRGDPCRVVAAFGHAVEDQAESGEGVALRSRAHVQAENEEPQPQVVFAFGLRITNCAPPRFSL